MEVQKVLESYIQATNTHNFEEVKKYLSSEAVFWFTNKEYKSLEQIEQYFLNSWELIKDEVYSVSSVKWIGIDHNLATCLYIYHWEGFHNGKKINGYGNATNVFKRINNEWKLIHEHLSPLYNSKKL